MAKAFGTIALTRRQLGPVTARVPHKGNARLIDYATLALTHGLLALAVIRLMMRSELDQEGEAKRPSRRSAHRKHGG